MLIVCALAASCSKEVHVENTKWKGVGASKNVELVLNDSDGFIIKHYSEIDRDSFCISYELIKDSVIVIRKDDIASMKESFIVTSKTLKSANMGFIKVQ